MIPYFSFDMFMIGPLTVHVWGLFAGLAFVFALKIALTLARRQNINEDLVVNAGIFGIASALIGARLLFVFEHGEYYAARLKEIFYFWDGGLSIYGGAILAFAVTAAYIRFSDLRGKFYDVLDIAAPALAAGEFVVRIGCALANEHIGAVTSLPWGQFYPFDGTLRHPVSIYLSLNGLALFLVIWFLKDKIKVKGVLFFAFLFLYSLTRFFLDFARCRDLATCDYHYYGYPGFTLAQYISLGIMAAAASLMIKKEMDSRVKSSFETKTN